MVRNTGGDEAWLLVSSILVQLMTPGVALFYSGLSPEAATVSALMMCLGCQCLVSLLWALIGFSLTFAPNSSTGVTGGLAYSTLDVAAPASALGSGGLAWAPTVSLRAFSMFQLMFAVLTSAIICGSLVGRVRWAYVMLFTAAWHLCVYCPLAHWVFFPGGWLAQLGVLDYAGGLVVHTSSGVSALVFAFLLRYDAARGASAPPPTAAPAAPPHNVPFVMLGTALLWFGWFGFNAGSALDTSYTAALALTNTQMGGEAGMLTHSLLDIALPAEGSSGWAQWLRGRPSAVGAAAGIVSGLVGITPAAGFVSPMWAVFIGACAALAAYPVPRFVQRALRVNDACDCFGIHGVAGIVGSLLTGVLACSDASGARSVADADANGALCGGAPALLAKQCAGVAVVVLHSGVATSAIFWALRGLARARGERIGFPRLASVDSFEHGEAAYFNVDRLRAAAVGGRGGGELSRSKGEGSARARARLRRRRTAARAAALQPPLPHKPAKGAAGHLALGRPLQVVVEGPEGDEEPSSTTETAEDEK